MALPPIDQPTFSITIPSTQEKVRYRPFLMKEEKILLIALESKDNAEINAAMQTIISNCTFGDVNVKDLTSFDLEYFFLKLRAKSIEETVNLKYACAKCETPIEFVVNLDEIEVTHNEKHNKNIKITDSIGIMMKYPSLDAINPSVNLDSGESKIDNILDLIVKSIDSIYDNDTVYSAKDTPQKELREWVEGLDQKSFTKVREFFETMPKVYYETLLTCEKCGSEGKVEIEGLQNFFG